MSVAIFSVIGIIVGALLQYLFTRHLDNQRHRRDLRTHAYTDYLRGVSDQANLRPIVNTPDSRELAAKVADSKCRICLYGSPTVVATFAAFEHLGATMNTPEQRQAFTRMVAAMRDDSATGKKVDVRALEAVLLGVPRGK